MQQLVHGRVDLSSPRQHLKFVHGVIINNGRMSFCHLPYHEMCTVSKQEDDCDLLLRRLTLLQRQNPLQHPVPSVAFGASYFGETSPHSRVVRSVEITTNFSSEQSLGSSGSWQMVELLVVFCSRSHRRSSSRSLSRSRRPQRCRRHGRRPNSSSGGICAAAGVVVWVGTACRLLDVLRHPVLASLSFSLLIFCCRDGNVVALSILFVAAMIPTGGAAPARLMVAVVLI